MRTSAIRVGFAVLLTLGLMAAKPRPESVGVQPDSACRIKELLNRRGWDIPGLSKAAVKSHGRYNSEGVPENVFVDIMKPEAAEGMFTYVGLQSCETAELAVRSIDVTEIEQFMMNGHTFGYRVTGTNAGFDNKGHRIEFASEERVYYYDPDGSGKFTMMRYDSEELIFKIVVPEWVKQASSSQTQPPNGVVK